MGLLTSLVSVFAEQSLQFSFVSSTIYINKARDNIMVVVAWLLQALNLYQGGYGPTRTNSKSSWIWLHHCYNMTELYITTIPSYCHIYHT